MNLIERVAVIAEIARKKQGRAGRLGKTALVKLLFLLQTVYDLRLGYRFSLYTYGPYTSEVMSDIDYAEGAGALSVDYDSESGYEIKPGPQNDEFHCQPSFAEKVERLMDHFGHLNARELELQSTILYVSRSATGQALLDTVLQIKPKFQRSEVEIAINDLTEARIVD